MALPIKNISIYIRAVSYKIIELKISISIFDRVIHLIKDRINFGYSPFYS